MPLNLLIADDSATIRKVVGLAFEGEDVTVLTAGNGQEALDKANEAKPDIIFADTEMPELNGFELCQKIKENEDLKKIPVCLLHSDFEEFDEGKYRICGADNHLPKPFKSEDILNKVAEMTGAAGKEKEDELISTNDLSVSKNMENEEKPQDGLEELEILQLDDLEEETQKDEDAIELKLKDTIEKIDKNIKASKKTASEPDPPANEIENFVEEIQTDDKMEENTKKELNEFNEALRIPDGELGEAEPFTEDEKSEPEDELETIMLGEEEKEEPVNTDEISLKETLSDVEKSSEVNQASEEIETQKETPEPELAGVNIKEESEPEVDIKEEKEDLIEDTGILPGSEVEASEIETPEIKKTDTISKLSKDANQITEDEFERLVGGYIKQVIEETLKEAIQGEISTITDKIIEAVERIAHEITPDISRTIIQKEIEKIKNPEP